MLAEVLRGNVCVGGAFVAIDPAICLDIGCYDAGGIEGFGDNCCAAVNAVWWCSGELSCIGVPVEEVDSVVDVGEVGGREGGDIDACG